MGDEPEKKIEKIFSDDALNLDKIDLYSILKDKEKLVEDRRLKNWGIWLQRRQEQYNRLCSSLNIEPECLVMNYETNINKLLDTRLIAEAEKYTYEDKYRGSIHFWKTVKFLKKDRKPQIENLVYSADVKFRDDPEVLVKKGYVDTPGGIQEENFSKPCAKKIRKPWELSETLKRKKEKLASKINLLEPFRPDIKNLMVKGVALFRPSIPSETNHVLTPDIHVEKAENDSSFDNLVPDNRNPCFLNKATLEIGSVLVRQQESVDDIPEDNNWELNFTNVAVYNIHTQSVNFKNVGPIAVHYRWEQTNAYEHHSLPIKYSKSNIPKFFFDVKSGILLPGQQFFLEFTFRSNKQGTFKEVWELHTEPLIALKPLKFVLQGIASENPEIDLGMTWEKAENYIQSCVKVSFATQLISDIDFDNKILNFQTDYNNLYLEKEIFEYINKIANYKSHCINSLRELRGKLTADKWDLSVKSVRTDIITLEKDCDLRHEYLGEFNTTVSKLTKPHREEQVHNVKYEAVYSILSSFVSQIPQSADMLQKIYKLQSIPVIKPSSPKFELSGSWENLRTIKLIQSSSSDEDFLRDYKKEMKSGLKIGGKGNLKRGSAVSAKRGSTKRGSTKRGSTKRGSTKRGSTKRQSTKRQSTKRQSTKRQSTKRQSTKRQSTKPGGARRQSKHPGGRKSVKEGASEKQAAKETKEASKKRPPAVKPPNIKLTKEKPERKLSIKWEPEPDRDLYRGLLISHVKDHLETAINQIASALDSYNTLELDKIPPMHIAFLDEGLKHIVIPKIPDLQQPEEPQIQVSATQIKPMVV
ncbi:MYCBP-associated protein-like [Cimex lectularius]|uniref:MYCBP-associated protein n=1 Tax=Cimex lectularius TaxID=79782 RepID=A0A8I6SL78_CIMLE|nr:MYCBP-associated protein-like [Cimex lectularius]